MAYRVGNQFNNDLYGTLDSDTIIGKGGSDTIGANNGNDPEYFS